MSELFAHYMPEAWFDEAGLRKTGRLIGGASATAIKRMKRWKHRAKDLSLRLAISAALAEIGRAHV